MSSRQPPLLADATCDLARFGAALQYDDIPAAVVARIKLSLLDSLGCCLFGATLPWTKKVAELADHEGAKPVATLIGFGRKTSAALAARDFTGIHSALDGLAAIMQEQQLKADDIARVEAGLSPMTHVHCAWEYKAQGVTAAQMNLYYGMAVIALDGAAFTEQFRESRLSDPRILNFIARISAHVDPEIEKMGAPFRHASRVKIATRDGRVFEKLSPHRRGSPENPLSPEEVVHKFRNVVAPCMDQAAAERIVTAVDGFETPSDLQDLMPLLGAAVRRHACVTQITHCFY